MKKFKNYFTFSKKEIDAYIRITEEIELERTQTLSFKNAKKEKKQINTKMKSKQNKNKKTTHPSTSTKTQRVVPTTKTQKVSKAKTTKSSSATKTQKVSKPKTTKTKSNISKSTKNTVFAEKEIASSHTNNINLEKTKDQDVKFNFNTKEIEKSFSFTTEEVTFDKATTKKILKNNKKKRPKKENQNLTNSGENIIELKNVFKYYGTKNKLTKVLDDVNLNIEKGEFVVLFGKSGSGKSTLLNLISGLDRPSSGDIIVANNSLPFLSNDKLLKFRRENVSFVFQSYNLLSNLNGIDNVKTGLYLQKDENKQIDIEILFNEFDLNEVKHKFPAQMSGGQQQRISILRALAKNSDIIFADEPTGALDSKTSKSVLKTLQKINVENKKTIIMVSHDETVVKYATRVIIINKAHIIEDKKLN